MYSAAYVVVRCLSVALYVTLVYCVETAKHIFTICLATPFLTVFTTFVLFSYIFYVVVKTCERMFLPHS